jgi:hypothetical protein
LEWLFFAPWLYLLINFQLLYQSDSVDSSKSQLWPLGGALSLSLSIIFTLSRQGNIGWDSHVAISEAPATLVRGVEGDEVASALSYAMDP